jgi:hypothetical protein
MPAPFQNATLGADGVKGTLGTMLDLESLEERGDFASIPDKELEAVLVHGQPLIGRNDLVCAATESKLRKREDGSLEVRISWHGRLLLGQAIMGETTGFMAVPVSTLIGDDQQVSEWGVDVQCFCEKKRWAGQRDHLGRSVPDGDVLIRAEWGSEHQAREPDSLEQKLKDAVIAEAVPVAVQRVSRIPCLFPLLGRC